LDTHSKPVIGEYTQALAYVKVPMHGTHRYAVVNLAKVAGVNGDPLRLSPQTVGAGYFAPTCAAHSYTCAAWPLRNFAG